MKERILEFLKKIALDKFQSPAEKEGILSSLDVDYEAARKKAFAIMEGLIKNYNFFQVQTIDSFINAILSGCAFKLDLSSNFRIKTDYSDYLKFSLDKLIDRAGHQKKVFEVFHKFLMQYLYLESRRGWFPKQDIIKSTADLFSKSNKYAGNFLRNKTEGKDLILKKKKILGSIGELAGDLPEGTLGNLEKNLSVFLERNRESFDIDNLSNYFAREEFPVKKGQKVPLKTKRLWQHIRKNIRELVESESNSVFNYYIDIFNMVMGDFRSLSKKDDVLFLEELNRRTRVLFDERSVTVPELYYRLAARFKHFLIDEFQDTSLLQWQNLFLMVEEALSSGGSLFYVGDKKQAIYRFRGGEVSLFDKVREKFKAFNLISWYLKQNYRSRKRIVEFCNDVFSKSNLKRFIEEKNEAKKGGIEFTPGDITEIQAIFEEAQQTHLDTKEDGYVKVELIESKNKDERNEAIKAKLISLIADLKKRFEYSDMALLTRENDDVELLTAWLLEADIPVESEKTLNIRNNSYIKELVSFLKFLNSPIDNLSFASFVLGEFFSRACGIEVERIRDFIFCVKEKSRKERGVYLYREFRKHFPDAWEAFIEEFFKNVGFLPLYELVISILSRFDCLKNFPEYQGFFMRFLELIKEQEEERQNLSLFLEYFDQAKDEDLYVQAPAGGAVKVMTIHKSKGLGFAVVIIPFLEMNVKVETDVTYTAGGQLVLMRLSEKHRLFSPALEEVYRQEYKKAFIDELNNIYVAFTRTQDELYIFMPTNTRRASNLARILISEENLTKGEQGQYKKEKGKGKEAFSLDIPVSCYKDWIQFLKDEFVDESAIKNREKLLFGEVVHYVLSFIGDLSKQDEDQVLKEAYEKTSRRFPWIDDLKLFQDIVKRLLKDKRCRPFFFLEEGAVYQEKDLVDSKGDSKRIDRLIVKEKEAWIIDFKSSKEMALKDEEQLKGYIHIVKDIYPDKKVKGVLIYLDDLSIKEING